LPFLAFIIERKITRRINDGVTSWRGQPIA
jgi:hypothetical protein